MPDLIANSVQRALTDALLDLMHHKLNNLTLRLLRQALQRNIRDAINKTFQLHLVTRQRNNNAVGNVLFLTGVKSLVLLRYDLDDFISERRVMHMSACGSFLAHELVHMLGKEVETVAKVPGAVDGSIVVALDDGDAVFAARDDVAVDLALDVVEEGVLASAETFFDFIHGGGY